MTARSSAYTTAPALRAVVLQHVPFEGPARIAEWLALRGHLVSIRALWRGEQPPRPDECDLLVVMGGPMGVDDTRRYPWLIGETESIRACVQAGVPTLGVCLGAQLLAQAMGASVYPAPQKEIGWWPVDFAAAQRALRAFVTRGHDEPAVGSADERNTTRAWRSVLEGLPATLRVLHWHGDTFDLPAGAVRIASSPVCENQAFVVHRHVVGVQFHLESTPQDAGALARASAADIGHGTWQLRARDPVAAMRVGALEHAGALWPVLARLLERLETEARAAR
jgi:GMP synthase-like glutamine amidotransferase